jgi:hypothetical protein
MTLSKIKNIIKNNRDFMTNAYTNYSLLQNEIQRQDTDLILGVDWHKYIDVRDHYNTFYLVLKDYEKFIQNLDTHFLDVHDMQLYNGIIGGIEERDAMEYLSEEWLVKNERLELESKELLHSIEVYLHEYEDYDDDDVIKYVIDNKLYYHYYILDNDESVLYYDTVKSYR